ncbi:MAG: hypothetical protein WD981_02640 [Gaiellaceae bacterium]
MATQAHDGPVTENGRPRLKQVVREGDERDRGLAAYLRRFPRAAGAAHGAVVVALEAPAPPR